MSKRNYETYNHRAFAKRTIAFAGGMALLLTGASGGCGVSIKNSSDSSNASCPANQLANVETSYRFFDHHLGGGHDASVQASGIVGNFMQEDYTCIKGDNIAQWNGDRLAALNNYESAHGQGLTSQLNFTWDELTNKISGDHQHAALAALEGTSDPETAALSFSSNFEECGECENSQREQYADQVYADARKYNW